MMRWSNVSVLTLIVSATAVFFPPTVAAATPVPTEVFSAKGAFAAALRSGKPVEIISEKNSTTRAWANPSGRVTAQIHGAPVRLRRDGRWLDYDMTLVRRADGTVVPRVHPDDLVLSGAVGAGGHDLATVAVKGERIGLGWNAALPEPVLEGAKATYRDVMAGVDLVLEARTSGFEQFFVVKDRAAAARVTGLTLPMRLGRNVFTGEGSGAGTWVSSDGRVIARMPEALMWDSQGLGRDGERKREAKVGVSLRGGRAELGIDQGWLNDAATRYPVTIDPGIVVDRPVGFDEYAQNTISVSDNQAKDELKLGYSDDPTCVEASSSQKCRTRSYLRFDGLAGYHNAKIYSARLYLYEFHSWSCTQFGWRATRTDNATGSLQWGSEPAWREDASSTNETKGWGTGCADGWVSTDVAPILDDSFVNGWNSASMVIHAVGDNSRDSWSLTDHNSWKKFQSMEGANKPYIHLEYDHIPALSAVQLEGDGSCGAGTGFRKYLALSNTNPRFTAHIKDDDKSPLPSFNVRLEVKATPVGGGTVLTGSSVNSAPNGTIEVRLSQPLDTSKVYTYQLRGMDLYGDGTPMEYTEWSPPCELGFDNATLTSPPAVTGIPTVLVDEDGDGTPEMPYNILNHATPAQLTFAPGAGDAGKVAAYRYGFSQSAIESPNAPTVPAGPDGSATIPVTRWELDSQGFPTGDSQLYVRGVTITGAQFSTNVIQVWQDPEAVIPPVTHVRGDVNGDGAADHAGYRELSATEGLFYSYFGRNDGTLSNPAHLMKAPYTNANSHVAQGDFSGDGKTDFAVFVADGANDVRLKALTSDGNGLKDVEVWSSKLAGAANLGKWSLTAMRILSGDVNADGMDDLVVAYPNGATSWMLKVFVATVVNGQLDFVDPANWLAAPAAYDISKVKLVIGQFDDQPGMDVAEFQDLGDCRTGLYLRESLTSGGVPTGQFHAGHLVWDSTHPSTWCLASSQFIAGRYGASGMTGIVAFYDNGGCSNKVVTFTVEYISAGVPRWFPNVPQWTLGDSTINTTWCTPLIEPSLRDLTGGGREDLVVAYRCCGPYQQRVWMFRDFGYTYTTMWRQRPPSAPVLIYIEGRAIFKTPETVAQGGLGPVGVGGVKLDHEARYQLVAKHSSKCVAVFDGVNGGSTTEGAAIQQRTCFAGYLNEQLTLEHLNASYVRLHPLHDPAKCLNVSGADPTNNVPIVLNTCEVGQAKEFWQVEYLTGLSLTPGDPNEVTVRLVSNLSGRCLDVRSAGMNDGAVLQQYDCLQGSPDQHFYLRKVPATNNGLLAQWTMNSVTPFNQTLADATGRNAWAEINGSSAVNNQNNNYLVLDGTSGYARTGGPVIDTSSRFTVSAWVKLNAVTGYQTAVAQEGSAYCAFYLGLNPDGKWHFELLSNINGGTYSKSSAISTTAAVTGTWVHLVGVYDTMNAYTGRIYVNGVLEGSKEIADRISASGPLVIGSAWSGGARVDRFGGAIDDVRAWDRALSDSEVAQLYAAGAS